jgi:ElaB/YqjD/DUF883 family membrane-anchored ribosome-binding protein
MSQERMNKAADEASRAAREAADEAAARAGDYYEDASEKGREAYERARGQGAELRDMGQHYYQQGSRALVKQVEEKPVPTLLLAAAAGFAVAWLLRR